LPLHFGKILTGSHGGNGNPSEDIQRFMNVEKLDKISLSALISKKYSLNEINIAIEEMKNGSIVGRVSIDLKRKYNNERTNKY